MGKFYVLIPAMVLLAASWVSAGTFEVLAQAPGVRQTPAKLFLKPGAVVKAEFRNETEMQLEQDTLFPDMPDEGMEPDPIDSPPITHKRRKAPPHREQTSDPRAVPRQPAEAGRMAPPPAVFPRGDDLTSGAMSQNQEYGDDLDADLEKDLVISPPPPKPSVTAGAEKNTREETRARAKSNRSKSKQAQRKARPKYRAKTTPERYAAYPSHIRKVKPVSQSGWSVPAGTYRPTARVDTHEFGVNNAPRRIARPITAESLQNGHRPGTPPMRATRVVREGVTVKLVPQPVPASYQAGESDSNLGNELLSTAADVIGLPFAFVSSLF